MLVDRGPQRVVVRVPDAVYLVKVTDGADRVGRTALRRNYRTRQWKRRKRACTSVDAAGDEGLIDVLSEL